MLTQCNTTVSIVHVCEYTPVILMDVMHHTIQNFQELQGIVQYIKNHTSESTPNSAIFQTISFERKLRSGKCIEKCLTLN